MTASTNGQVLDEETVEKARYAGGMDFQEIGHTGLQHQGGQLYEEQRQALAGDRGVAIFREMSEEDPTIGAGLLAIDNMVRAVSWDFEPPADSGKEGERWADLCRSSLHDMSMSWADTVSSFFSMVPYGWHYANVVLKQRDGEQPYKPDDPEAKASSDYDDGLIGWRVMSPRSQDSKLRWELDARGNVRGMWQQILGGPAVMVPIEHSALFRTSTKKNSPEGTSVLRSAWRPWHFLRQIEVHEGIGIERDLAGLPVGGAPSSYLAANAKPAEKATVDAMRRILANVRANQNGFVLWPSDRDENGHAKFPFSLMTSGSRRPSDLNSVVMRKRAEIAGCMLADWLTLGHEANGSRSLGSAKMDMFTSALTVWVQNVSNVFDAHLTPRLMRANGVSPKLGPKLRPGKIEQVDIEQFSSAFSQLVTSGALTNTADTERWMRSQIGAPPIEDDDWRQHQSGLVLPRAA